jgi:hypothetical protein
MIKLKMPDDDMVRNLLGLIGGKKIGREHVTVFGTPQMVINAKELEGRLIGFFDKQKQMGIGLITAVNSNNTIYDTVDVSVLFGDKQLEIRIKCMASDGSLWITNNTELPYCQFIKEEKNDER